MSEEDTITYEVTCEEAVAVALCIHYTVTEGQRINGPMPEDMRNALRSFSEKNIAAITAQKETDWDSFE